MADAVMPAAHGMQWFCMFCVTAKGSNGGRIVVVVGAGAGAGAGDGAGDGTAIGADGKPADEAHPQADAQPQSFDRRRALPSRPRIESPDWPPLDDALWQPPQDAGCWHGVAFTHPEQFDGIAQVDVIGPVGHGEQQLFRGIDSHPNPNSGTIIAQPHIFIDFNMDGRSVIRGFARRDESAEFWGSAPFASCIGIAQQWTCEMLREDRRSAG